jgi:hypothetical protein
MRTGTRVEWFFEKVDQRGPDECWLWKAGKNRAGYGVFGVGAKRAHRWIWEFENGPIPPGMLILHKCDTPACVNPAHLRLGTHSDNMRERCEKGRTLKAEHANAAKLSNADAERIREMYLFGAKCPDMARAFGVTRETIGNVVHRRTFASIGA